MTRAPISGALPRHSTCRRPVRPVSVASVFAEVLGKLDEACHARLPFFPLEFLLAKLKPAAQQLVIEVLIGVETL